MPELEKILPLVLIALWYIFRGGRKKNKRQAPQQFEQDAPTQEPVNKAPGSKPTSLQDILEELMGEEKAKKPAPTYRQPVPEPKREPKRRSSYKTEAESLETLDPIIENYEESKRSQEAKDLIKKYAAFEADDEKGEGPDFDLRQAIIHQVILDRPYKD